jgi:hypothetical protein
MAFLPPFIILKHCAADFGVLVAEILLTAGPGAQSFNCRQYYKSPFYAVLGRHFDKLNDRIGISNRKRSGGIVNEKLNLVRALKSKKIISKFFSDCSQALLKIVF